LEAAGDSPGETTPRQSLERKGSNGEREHYTDVDPQISGTVGTGGGTCNGRGCATGVATGGTIANQPDGRVPVDKVIADIRRNFPETHSLLDSVTLEVTDILRVGSGSLSGENFLLIAKTVNRVIHEPGVRGVIVTHGTSTSEDTAFFLNLLVKSEKPVVVANSQRMHTTLGNDGDKNFIDAIRVVLSPSAIGKGAMVVSNQTINSGREVLKTSVRPDAFVSGEHGLLGVIESDRVDFYRAPTRRHTARTEFDVNAISALPKVEIVYTYFDADPALIEAAAKSGAKGIIVNGFTTGGSPYQTQVKTLEELAAKGTIIVQTARGGVNNRIPFEESDRFIEGDNLVAHKARILLQLAFTKTSDPKEIQRIFDEY
jgi:L-asparaginase